MNVIIRISSFILRERSVHMKLGFATPLLRYSTRLPPEPRTAIEC